MLTVAETTLFCQCLDILERSADAFIIVCFPELKLAHSRRIKNQTTLRQQNQLTICGRMLSAIVGGSDLLDALDFATNQPIDQCRFSDSGRTQKRDSLSDLQILA